MSELINADATRVSRRLFADPGIYRDEQERIFSRCWLFLGHTSELAQPGQFFTSRLGEVPVIVARGTDGKVHVSVNSCSHRGLPVCRAERGQERGFTCPYHNWHYDLSGALRSVPAQHLFGEDFHREQHGLKRIPRVEEYKGLLFASLNESIESLESYLGDMRFYLDCMLDRSPVGTEVIGAPQKWRIRANWKMPAENQTGDQYHAPYLHATNLPLDQTAYQHDGSGLNFALPGGHGGSLRLLPKDSPDRERILGLETLAGMDRRVQDYFLSVQGEVERRLGSVRARMRPLNYNVFPNLAFIWPMFTLRLTQPCGPGEVEMWSWLLLDRDAPDYVRRAALQTYTRAFGPAGAVEMEDGEAWAEQHRGSRIRFLDDRPYIYGTLRGSEGPHPELPGLLSPALSDHNIRNFYQHWAHSMGLENPAAEMSSAAWDGSGTRPRDTGVPRG